MESCIFCKIIDGQIPGAFVHQDERAVIFLDLNQAARGHLLIVPRDHVSEWHLLADELAAHLGKLAARWAAPALRAMEAEGYNLFVNNGAAAGQEVMHVHMHLIPRKSRDGYFQGRFRHHQAEAAELQATAEALRAAMRQDGQ